MKIHIICASTRSGRVGYGVSLWTQRQLEAAGHVAEIVDLRDHKLPFIDAVVLPSAMEKNYPHPAVQAWSQVIDQTENIIFVTPEYNHGYPGELKNAIDWLYAEWAGKPTAIVSYSGSVTGGARAAEQLKLVLNQVGSKLGRSHVFLPGVYAEDGSDIAEAATGQIKGLLAGLSAVQ